MVQNLWKITTHVVSVKSTVEISQIFVVFLECMNFNTLNLPKIYQNYTAKLRKIGCAVNLGKSRSTLLIFVNNQVDFSSKPAVNAISGSCTGLLCITWYSRQDPEMAWCSFFAVQQQLFFGAINKTEVQKIDIKIEVEVSSWLWLD